MDSDSDESRGEQISLAEARRPYQITMVNHVDMLKLDGHSPRGSSKCLRLLRHSLPHLVLLLLTLGYICLVAIVFYIVEGNNERKERVKLEMAVEISKRNLMAQIHNLAPNIPIEKLHRETEQFAREMLRLGWTRGRLGMPFGSSGAMGGNNASGHEPIWTWANSLLFATTLLSKIGYGHLFPLTSLGKALIAPILLLGLPLFLVTVADVSKFLEDFLKWSYWKGRKFCQKCWLAVQRRRRARKKPPPPSGNGQKNNASIKSSRSQKTQPEGEEKSTPVLSLNLNDLSMAEEEEGEGEECEQFTYLPFLLPFMLFLLLWALLAVLYFHLEGWTWLDSFYFVLITISAIGFGDFVPSSALSALLTACLIIPVFAFIALLIDKATAVFIQKFHQVGSKFAGIYEGVRARVRRRKKRRAKTSSRRN